MLYQCYDELFPTVSMVALPFPKKPMLCVCYRTWQDPPANQFHMSEIGTCYATINIGYACPPRLLPRRRNPHHYGWATMHSSFRRSQCSLNWRTDHGNIHLNQRRIQEFQKYKHRYKTKIWLKKILLCK